MTLRPELMPPVLDPSLVEQLARLANRLDGGSSGDWEVELAEFHQLSGTEVPIEEFQGIYCAEDHADWVRRILFRRRLAPDPALTLEEMTEIVERVVTLAPDADFYRELFTVNCRHPSGTDLIYWPNLVDELPDDREPTAEEIAALALRGSGGSP